MPTAASLDRARDFVDFLNDSPTPFHAVRTAKQRLEKAGFKQIKERDPWTSSLQPGGKYYLTRNGSTIVAFAIGHEWKPGNPVAIVGAHTDSCTLRVKPVSKRTADGFIQIAVEAYGGGMWHSWFDRDLGIAGRVMVKSKDGHMEQKLIRIHKPICRRPALAVHFGGSVPFEFNKETQLFPLAGLVSAELNRVGKTAEEYKKTETNDKEPFSPLKSTVQRHHSHLIDLVAKEAGTTPDNILDFELTMYDTQASCIGGLNDEFIFSQRLDNLGMTYCSVQGLIDSVKDTKALDNDSTIRLIACFDHEEIGSTSPQGAASNILPAILRRISCLPSAAQHSDGDSSTSDKTWQKISSDEDFSTAYEQTLATSLLISADMAHSVNPNYAGKYEQDHKPEINAGTVIKVNANVRYATDTPGIVLLQECARRAKPASFRPPGSQSAKDDAGVPLQLFVVRNDCPCGSTIGPTLSAKLGVRTIDVGNAQLSMHSIRETCGSYDVEHGINLFASFFEHYGELESKMLVD